MPYFNGVVVYCKLKFYTSVVCYEIWPICYISTYVNHLFSFWTNCMLRSDAQLAYLTKKTCIFVHIYFLVYLILSPKIPCKLYQYIIYVNFLHHITIYKLFVRRYGTVQKWQLACDIGYCIVRHHRHSA